MFRLPNPSWFLAIFLIAAVAFVGCDSLSTTEDDGDGFDPSAELTKLSGEWVLFDGNNPSTIGSEIEISGNQGTLTSVAGGSLRVGDVKWDDITPTGTSEYDHQELGSDRNYYDASMRLQNDSTLTITVDAAGAGNQQTWTRKGTRGTGQNNAELAKIAGDWIRIGGNNASNDGMEVQVDGNTGTVTDPASSGFSSGDVKWDQITPQGNGVYEHLELGSDGNYYDGSITLLNDSTLEVSVASAGTGNEQTWARSGTQDRNTGEAITLSCNAATEDLTLSRLNDSVDYIVPSGCVMDVTARLVIEPGVTIAFEENAGMGVYSSGSLTAEGAGTQAITFQGTSNVKGWWRGIHIESNSLNNRLDHAVIENAGSNYVYCCNNVASLYQKDGRLSLTNTTIRNGSGHGLVARNAGSFEAYSNITVTGHDETPVRIGTARLNELDGTGSDYTGNTRDAVEISTRSISDATRIPELNVPYLMDEGVVDVTEPFTVDPGVEIQFGQDSGIGVYDSGSLNAQGTGSRPIVFRGTTSARGWWRGVHIETSSPDNLLLNMEIRDAGGNYVYCCNEPASLYFNDGEASVVNTTIANGASYGMYAASDFAFVDFTGNRITDHAEAPMYMAIERVNEIDGMGSDYTGNDEDYLRIFRSTADGEVTWPRTNLPYLVDANRVIDITAPLTIEAGAEIVMGDNSGLGVYDTGALTINGTSANRVILRGFENTQGYWRGIHTETNSTANNIQHTTIRNAGSTYVYCCNPAAGLFVRGGQMTIESSTVSGSGGCGITYRSGATLNESANTFSNNADGDVCAP